MSQQVLALTVPTSPGSTGAAIDVRRLKDKWVQVAGTLSGQLAVEGSLDGVEWVVFATASSSADGSVFEIAEPLTYMRLLAVTTITVVPSVRVVGETADTAKPVVDDFSPPLPSTGIGATTPVFFSITDDSADFRRVLVLIEQDGVTELVHDGDAFVAPYAVLSSRSVIANGFRYRVRRTGGWQSDVTLRVFAIDKSGNENA